MITFTTADRRYSVTSHGNGWAYCVTDQTTGEDFWVQDSDADALREATNDFENTAPIAEYMEVLGE